MKENSERTCSVEPKITLDWSNRNVNSISDYDSIEEEEEACMSEWHVSESPKFPSIVFKLNSSNLLIVSIGEDSPFSHSPNNSSSSLQSESNAWAQTLLLLHLLMLIIIYLQLIKTYCIVRVMLF